MNAKMLIVLCIVLVLVTMMMGQAEARCQFRCKVSCRPRCHRRRCRVHCSKHCGLHCGGKIGDEPEKKALEDDNDSVSLPSNFNDYDENKDGKISLNELRNVIPTDDNERFSVLDKNGDSFINCDEFMTSNLEFGDKQPSC